jgi:amino acid adenylation domain-containing protein
VPARTLSDLLEASSQRFPHRPAVVDSAGAALTYSELQIQSDALAWFLNDRGVRPGDRVAVAIPKSLDAIISLFGIMKAGAAYVPMDAWGPMDRGRRILEDSDVSAAIVNSRTTSMVPKASDIPLIAVARTPDVAGAVPFEDAIETGKTHVLAPYEPGDVAYIIFTSGSTGAPKGALITHANALSFLGWCSSEFRPDETDRFANYSPLYFDPSVFDVYHSVKHGASVHLVADELAKRPADLAAFIATRRLTFWCSTPSALMMLARFGELDSHDCTSLRTVAFGGEVFPARPLRELRAKWQSPAFYNLYGPTETTTACTCARIPDEIPADRTTPYPIGFPGSHCSAMLLDEHGEPVAAGEDGLLHISGPSVFAGYWNRPEETAASMVERNAVRWYNTGDVVRWHPREGYTYVARRDGMVKRRGFRIEVGEIEQAFYRHPSVAEAAVVAVPEPDATVKIAAFLVWNGPAPSTVALKTFCATTLPAYMSPDLFVFLDQLPRTSTDKVDLRALKSRVSHASVG